MAANLNDPFGPSCCEGSTGSNAQSAQPCGCDAGADHLCRRHKAQEAGQIRQAVEAATGVVDRPTRASTLPTDSKSRKQYPLFTGVMAYFPDALVAIAHVSYVGNEQHNPGQPLHWAREKSTDQHDTLLRHLAESGKVDIDGQRHSAKMAWRALAILQLEIEQERKE